MLSGGESESNRICSLMENHSEKKIILSCVESMNKGMSMECWLVPNRCEDSGCSLVGHISGDGESG